MRASVDRNDKYAVHLCDNCAGSGKVLSLTTFVRRPGDIHTKTVKHFDSCHVCAGSGEADLSTAYHAAVRRAEQRRALDSAAIARIHAAVSR